MIITDEELQQDVQRAGEDAVRNGHGDPLQSALEHVHGGSVVFKETGDKSAGGLLHSPVWTGLGLGDHGGGGLVFTRSGGALLLDGEPGGTDGREAVKSPRRQRL